MYFNIDVKQIAQRTLFSSLKHNGALFDYMYVDHSLKTVFVFQVSSLSADKHSLRAGTVRKVMAGFHFFDKGNDGYRMKYIYCCKSDERTLVSCKLTNEADAKSTTEQERQSVLSDADLEAVTKRFEVLIARIHFFPSDTHIVLDDQSNEGNEGSSITKSVADMIVKEIKEELRRLGLPTKGLKPELQSRLNAAIEKANPTK
jgi:hypothetical protein